MNITGKPVITSPTEGAFSVCQKYATAAFTIHLRFSFFSSPFTIPMCNRRRSLAMA